MPNLLKIQKDSYQWFLDEGLREVFRDVGTITDYQRESGAVLPGLSPCGISPSILWRSARSGTPPTLRPIKVRVRLRNTETDEIKEQEIFMGDFPLMTNGGTFVINGGRACYRLPDCPLAPACTTATTVDKADQPQLHRHCDSLPRRLAGI